MTERKKTECFTESEVAELLGLYETDVRASLIEIAKEKGKSQELDFETVLTMGFRARTKEALAFRKWATASIADGRDITYRFLRSTMHTDDEKAQLAEVINTYSRALDLLDDYDHQRLSKPQGTPTLYRLQYEECREIIDGMKFGLDSALFGIEKEKGKLEGILSAVYQSVCGAEAYPTIQEKAANLLYFLVKDHPFVDGCKRIAATLFLVFLHKNKELFSNNKPCLSNEALVAVTIMTAESNPQEKDIIVRLIMNLLLQ